MLWPYHGIHLCFERRDSATPRTSSALQDNIVLMVCRKSSHSNIGLFKPTLYKVITNVKNQQDTNFVVNMTKRRTSANNFQNTTFETNIIISLALWLVVSVLLKSANSACYALNHQNDSLWSSLGSTPSFPYFLYQGMLEGTSSGSTPTTPCNHAHPSSRESSSSSKPHEATGRPASLRAPISRRGSGLFTAATI